MKKSVKKIVYVLKKSLRRRGDAGDVIKVAAVHGRYLESQQIAQRATQGVLQDLEAKKQQWKMQEAEHIKLAQELIDKIAGMEITLKKRVSQSDKLYEAVRADSIVSAFAQQGIEIRNENVKLDQQIKKLGQYSVTIHAYGNLETRINLSVAAED